MENYIIEENVLIVLADGNEHEYTAKCYDGRAECTPVDENDEPVILKYPTLDSVINDSDKTYEILRYRGLFDCNARDITFGDVMIRYGKIKA